MTTIEIKSKGVSFIKTIVASEIPGIVFFKNVEIDRSISKSINLLFVTVSLNKLFLQIFNKSSEF